MYSMLLSLVVGVVVGTVTYHSMPLGWCIVLTLLAMMLVHVAVLLAMRLAAKRINAKIQTIMLEVQQKLQGMQNRMMRRPTGSVAQMRQALEREQNAGLDRIIASLDLFKPLCRWNFFMVKQVNTMRMMFLYQQRKFDEVDKLLPKCVFFDPQSMCMKMARMYKRKDPKLDKFFRWKCSRLKADAAVLPVALYSWILVKENRIDDAIKVLNDAKAKTSNETLAHNREALQNGRVKQFSNAPLGEAWYALMLEEPKMQKVQQQMRYR